MAAETVDNGKDDGASLGLTTAQTKDARLAFQTATETGSSSRMALTMVYVSLGVEIGSKKRVVEWLICPCFEWSTKDQDVVMSLAVVDANGHPNQKRYNKRANLKNDCSQQQGRF
jgi:hypothetical protein